MKRLIAWFLVCLLVFAAVLPSPASAAGNYQPLFQEALTATGADAVRLGQQFAELYKAAKWNFTMALSQEPTETIQLVTDLWASQISAEERAEVEKYLSSSPVDKYAPNVLECMQKSIKHLQELTQGENDQKKRLLENYQTDPVYFIQELSKEPVNVQVETAKILVATVEDTNRFLTELRRLAVERAWTDDEWQVIHTMFHSVNSMYVFDWIGSDQFFPTERKDYYLLLRGYTLFDGVISEDYIAVGTKLFQRDPKGFIQELAMLDSMDQDMWTFTIPFCWLDYTPQEIYAELQNIHAAYSWTEPEQKLWDQMISLAQQNIPTEPPPTTQPTEPQPPATLPSVPQPPATLPPETTVPEPSPSTQPTPKPTESVQHQPVDIVVPIQIISFLLIGGALISMVVFLLRKKD